MMRHIPEELISQWLDRELDSREAAFVQEHLNECESCAALEREMSEVGRLFRTAEALQPPSYLWSRIAVRLDEEKRERGVIPSWLRWLPVPARIPYPPVWLQTAAWAPAAILLIVIGSTIAFMEYESVTRARIAAIAEIDRAHVALLTLNNKTLNPFHESTATDSGINPFTQSNLKDEPNPFRALLDRQ